MTNIIIILTLLTTPYLFFRMLSTASVKSNGLQTAAIVGLSLVFAFTALGHFVQTEAMTQMLPPWVPERKLLVYLTGFLELAIALGFWVRGFRRATGIIAFAALVLFFPANIYAAFNHIPLGGHNWGPMYLLVRTPLQIVLLIWVYWFAIKLGSTPSLALHQHRSIQRTT